MKYVTLQHPKKITIVVAGYGLTHAQLAAPYQAQGYTAYSAGFVRFLDRGRFECFGFSESPKLHPHPDDPRILQAWHHSMLSLAPATVETSPCSQSRQNVESRKVGIEPVRS